MIYAQTSLKRDIGRQILFLFNIDVPQVGDSRNMDIGRSGGGSHGGGIFLRPGEHFKNNGNIEIIC